MTWNRNFPFFVMLNLIQHPERQAVTETTGPTPTQFQVKRPPAVSDQSGELIDLKLLKGRGLKIPLVVSLSNHAYRL